MAPNLFVCLRTVLCPLYWFHRGDRIKGPICHTEHWNSPVPGIYRYIPGSGWHLISRDGNNDAEKVPVPLTYCHILHQHLFQDEMDSRCSWHCVTLRDGEAPEKLRFFLLDDGCTWVAGWNSHGKPIPGPYKKWRLDPSSNSMCKIESCPGSASASRAGSVAGKEWAGPSRNLNETLCASIL